MIKEAKRKAIEIIQGSPEWLQAKQSKIGASEIFTLVAYYCKDELKQANIDLDQEKPFKTPLELYLKIKFQVQDGNFSEVNREFGLGMEDYITYRMDLYKRGLHQVDKEEFVINEGVHKLACCSPDRYIDFILNYGNMNSEGNDKVIDVELETFDGKEKITKEWGGGVLEEKTTQFTFNYEAKKGLKWGYIFQLQYQMLVCAKKWGILAAISPKEKSYDTDFFKGKVLGMLELQKGSDKDLGLFLVYHGKDKNLINDYYNLYHYIYPENKTIQNLCILALKRFQKALDDNMLPVLSIDCLVRLQREKSLLAKMYPSKYGSIVANEELDGLLRDEREANIQVLKDGTERQNYICEIIKKMGSHQVLIGSESTAKFAKDGSLRFSKTKEKKYV